MSAPLLKKLKFRI